VLAITTEMMAMIHNNLYSIHRWCDFNNNATRIQRLNWCALSLPIMLSCIVMYRVVQKTVT